MASFSIDELRNFAIELERLGNKYAKLDEDVRSFMVGMAFILDQAKKMKIREPLEPVPGTYRFLEGDLRKYDDLEHAYVRFANRLSRDDESYQSHQKVIRKLDRPKEEG